MKEFLMVVLGILIFVVIFQIAKASEYVSVLKGEEKTRKQNNCINAFLLMGLLVFGLIGVWYCNELYYGKTLFPQGSASVEGEKPGSDVHDHNSSNGSGFCTYTDIVILVRL